MPPSSRYSSAWSYQYPAAARHSRHRGREYDHAASSNRVRGSTGASEDDVRAGAGALRSCPAELPAADLRRPGRARSASGDGASRRDRMRHRPGDAAARRTRVRDHLRRARRATRRRRAAQACELSDRRGDHGELRDVAARTRGLRRGRRFQCLPLGQARSALHEDRRPSPRPREARLRVDGTRSSIRWRSVLQRSPSGLRSRHTGRSEGEGRRRRRLLLTPLAPAGSGCARRSQRRRRGR